VVRRRIDEAFAACEETKDIRCRGVSKDIRDPKKLKIILKTDEEVKTVRIH